MMNNDLLFFNNLKFFKILIFFKTVSLFFLENIKMIPTHFHATCIKKTSFLIVTTSCKRGLKHFITCNFKILKLCLRDRTTYMAGLLIAPWKEI